NLGTESHWQPGLLVRRHESGWQRCRDREHARPGRDAEQPASGRAARSPTPPRSFFANLFKIPTLWGIKDTAPYFHDNSAKTLEEVAEHYAFFFFNSPSTRGFVFTKQEQADMVAFLKLLR